MKANSTTLESKTTHKQFCASSMDSHNSSPNSINDTKRVIHNDEVENVLEELPTVSTTDLLVAWACMILAILSGSIIGLLYLTIINIFAF